MALPYFIYKISGDSFLWEGITVQEWLDIRTYQVNYSSWLEREWEVSITQKLDIESG